MRAEKTGRVPLTGTPDTRRERCAVSFEPSGETSLDAANSPPVSLPAFRQIGRLKVCTF
jgi:hypothetical protein